MFSEAPVKAPRPSAPVWEGEVIVYSSKPLFFAATAMMGMASFYGSELAAQRPDMEVSKHETVEFPPAGFGTPRQLNVPPGFPAEAWAASGAERCRKQPGAALAAMACEAVLSAEPKPAPAALPLDELEKKGVSKAAIAPTPAAVQP